MTPIEKLERLEVRLRKGEVSVEDLPLNLEPLLGEAVQSKSDEEFVRKIMNDLELVLFTLLKENQLKAAEEIMGRARAFIDPPGQSHSG
jgi:hypothetical protein